MTRERRGTVSKSRGHWVARVYLSDRNGIRHETRVRGKQNTRSSAVDARDDILREVEELGPDEYLRRKDLRHHPLDEDPGEAPKTFGDLSAKYRAEYAIPPKTRDGHTYAGMRSWKTALEHVTVLEAELGKALPLSEITFERVRALKMKRLDTPISRKGWKKERPRSFANVNRLLAVLRRMLKIGKRLGWLADNPFDDPQAGKDRLIDLSHETPKERILSPAEEKRLLKELSNSARERSRLAVLALIDTGARTGEILRVDHRTENPEPGLRWKDVDFAAGVVSIFGSKTEKARTVGLTKRLAAGLEEHRPSGAKPGDRVFAGLSYTVLYGDFRDATAAAGIEGLTLHSLRHTRATRWIQGGLTESEVAHLLGHSKKSNVTRRYINPDAHTIARSLLADSRFSRNAKKRAEAVN